MVDSLEVIDARIDDRKKAIYEANRQIKRLGARISELNKFIINARGGLDELEMVRKVVASEQKDDEAPHLTASSVTVNE